MFEFLSSLIVVVTNWLGLTTQVIQQESPHTTVEPTVTIAPSTSETFTYNSYPDSERPGWLRTKITTEIGDISVSYPERWKIRHNNTGYTIFILESDDYEFDNSGNLVQGGSVELTVAIEYAEETKFNTLDNNAKYATDIKQDRLSFVEKDAADKYLEEKFNGISWITYTGKPEDGVINADTYKIYRSSYSNIIVDYQCAPANLDYQRIIKNCDEILDTVTFDFNT